MERSLVIKFIGKDEGLSALGRKTAESFSGVGPAVQKATTELDTLTKKVSDARSQLQRGLKLELDLSDNQADALIKDFQRLQQEGADLGRIFQVLGDRYDVAADQVAKVAARFRPAEPSHPAAGGSSTKAGSSPSPCHSYARSLSDLQSVANNTRLDFKGAKELSNNLGLTEKAAARVVQRFQELEGVPVAAKFRALRGELGVTQQQFDELQRTIGVTSEGLAGIAAVTGTVAAGIGTAATVSVREFAAFDDSLTSFSAKSGIARDDLGSLEAQAVSLAAVTSQTPASVAALSTPCSALGPALGMWKTISKPSPSCRI
ncbi:MAG: hypothetical protein HC812_19135 [Leptolyngbya sp. RL_3_1]|nr:hypothetical protein [Leptolyngbya sp. RL_3_1]